jgi:hypothetical protein
LKLATRIAFHGFGTAPPGGCWPWAAGAEPHSKASATQARCGWADRGRNALEQGDATLLVSTESVGHDRPECQVQWARFAADRSADGREGLPGQAGEPRIG